MNKQPPHYQVMMGSYTVKDFVDQIDKAYKDSKETGEGILIAPFQRTYQWHIKKNGESPLYLLDSLNQNIFVMPIILVEHNKQTWIIDGQQRLATLYCYEKGYQPREDKPIKWEELITAIQEATKRDNKKDYDKKYSKLVKKCKWTKLDKQKFNKDNILNTPIGYSFLFNVNHEDDSKLLINIFDRINNQGMNLSENETIMSYIFLEQNKEYKPLTEFIKVIEKLNVNIFKHQYLSRTINIIRHILKKEYTLKRKKQYQFLKSFSYQTQFEHTKLFIKDILLRKITINLNSIENFIHTWKDKGINIPYIEWEDIECFQEYYYSLSDDEYEEKTEFRNDTTPMFINSLDDNIVIPTLYFYYHNIINENHAIFNDSFEIDQYDYIEQIAKISINSDLSINDLTDNFQTYILDKIDE